MELDQPTRQRHEGMPKQNKGAMECPYPTHQTEILCVILIFVL